MRFQTNKKFNLSHYPKLIFGFFFILLFASYLKIFAIGSPYQSGETLDPACTPGESNCFVRILPDQSGNSGKFLTTNGTVASWGTVDFTPYFAQNGNSYGGLTTLGTNDNNALAFETNGVEKVRINTNGNVGIGTTNAQATVEIANTSPTFRMNNTASSGDRYSEIQFATNGTVQGYLWHEYNSAASINSIALGNGDGVRTVRIGNIGGELSVGAGAPGYSYAANTYKTYIQGFGTSTSTTAVRVDNSANSPLLSIRDNGNIGVGTTTDGGYKLDVNGTARVTGDFTLGGNSTAKKLWFDQDWQQYIQGEGTTGIFTISNGAGPGWTFRIRQNNNAIPFTINASNRVLIGTTSDNSAGVLQTAGAIAPATDNSYTLGTSSYRWGNLYSGGETISNSYTYSSGTNAAQLVSIAPTINTSGGTNTIRGIYYNPTLTLTTGTTHIAFDNTSGTNYFNSTSNNTYIGYASGTSSPTGKLNVNGIVNAEGNISANSGFSYVKLIPATGEIDMNVQGSRNVKLSYAANAGNQLSSAYGFVITDMGTGSVGSLKAKHLIATDVSEFSNNMWLTSSTDNYIRFVESGTANRGVFGYGDGDSTLQIRVGGATTMATGTLAMAVPSTGNVLVGTTTDAGYKFDVNGSARMNSSLTVTSAATFNSTITATQDGHRLGNLQILTSGTAGTTGLGIKAAGGLTFMSTSATTAAFNFDHWAGSGTLGSSGGGTQYVVRLGMGFSAPNLSNTNFHELYINPTYNFATNGQTGTIVRGIYYNPTLTDLTATTHLAIETVTGDLRFGTTSGNVSIGNINSTYKLEVGSASVSGIVARFVNSTGTCDINPTTTALSCSSDRNLKKNITTLDASTLDKILALNPVTYNWNSEGDGTPVHNGFIAQEVESIFPDLVSTDSTSGLKSLNYMGLIPYSIKAIQDLSLRVQSLPTFTDSSLATKVMTFLEGVANGRVESDDINARKKICIYLICNIKKQFEQILNKN